MKTLQLREKLLMGAVGIGAMMALAYTSAVSWVIHRQYLDQSNGLLLKASDVIREDLSERKADLLAATQQLATQKNLGSTIWYLTQYAKSDLDRDTLFNTYRQLVRDTYKAGQGAKAFKVAIYNSAGNLISFALFDKGGDLAGFVERGHVASFQIASMKAGEEFNRNSLRSTQRIAGIDLKFAGRVPQQESVNYEVVNGSLSIESRVPIVGDAFSPTTGKPLKEQLGLVVMTQPLDDSFVSQISRLTGTRINVFTPQGLSSGSVAAYRTPDWRNAPTGAAEHPEAVALNEIAISGTDYYQGLIPLYASDRLVGSIAALYSKDKVQESTWEMIRTLWLISLASSLFILPFAWYFASTISRPLRVLSHILRRLASSGQAGMPNDELKLLDKEKSRQDELGDLTQSFIAMNAAVDQKIKQINEINATLEKTIDERTSALVAKEQEARTLIDNSPDTIARYDRECRRVFVNAAFGAMVEGGVTSLLRTRPSEWPGGSNSEIYEAKIREVFATGENTHFELKWPGKDGKVFSSHIRLTAEFDQAGNVATVLGVGRDITELKQTEQELADAKARWEFALEGAGDGVWDWNIQTGTAFFSKRYKEMLGYADDEIGDSAEEWLKRVHPDDLPNTMEILQAHIDGKTPSAIIEHRLRCKDGSWKWVLGRGIVVKRDAMGKPIRLVGTNTDITERILALQQLEEKELSKTRFLAAAGHDLRQPLAAANLFIDALKFSGPTPAQDQIIQRLEQTMSTFNGLLDALLNISKLDAGVIRAEYTSINVTELMNWLEQNFAPLAAERKLGFKLHFSMREPLVVRSDIGLVKSVLMNLVSNAIKFTSSGAILVSARRRGNEVLFQVWDTGMGIRAENIERIFDEFYQIDNPQRDRSRGLGLGLPIAKRALTLLGGRITCRSQIGHGSVFGFLLPFDQASSKPEWQAVAPGTPDLTASQQFVRGKHFVVVEDDSLVAQAIIRLLEGMGGEVKCFHSAEDALRHPHIEQADCYIADYMLGGTLNGMQLLTRLQQKLGKPITAVLMTGDTSTATLRHAKECDWPVLHKPVNTFQLISALRDQALSA